MTETTSFRYLASFLDLGSHRSSSALSKESLDAAGYVYACVQGVKGDDDFCCVAASRSAEVVTSKGVMPPNAVACLFGHRMMWQKALVTKADYYVFFEDDILALTSHSVVKDVLQDAFNQNYDIVHLCDQRYKDVRETDTFGWGTMAYAMTASKLKECLAIKTLNPVDSLIHDFLSLESKILAVPDGILFKHNNYVKSAIND